MNRNSQQILFRGGSSLSVLPLVTFIVVTILLVMNGAPAVEGMIIAAMLGISIGMIFARNFAEYSERVFSLMANRIATVAIVCWLWAGAFSGILANSGLVEAIVWVGWKLNLTGAWFTVAVFISAAIVFIVAVSGRHFLAALTAGIAAAIIIGPLAGIFPIERFFMLRLTVL